MNLRNKQTGSALIISLIILLLVTIIGVSSMQGTTIQERMAGNTKQVHLSFHAAESGVKAVELLIDSGNSKQIDCEGYIDRFFDESLTLAEEQELIEYDFETSNDSEGNEQTEINANYVSGYCRFTPPYTAVDTGLDTTSGSIGEISRELYSIVSIGKIGVAPNEVETQLIVTYEVVD